MGRSFCIVGEQGSGKSMMSAYLQKKFPGYHVIRSGPLWDEIVGRPLTHYERTVVQKEIVEEKGEQYFVDFMINKIKRIRESEPDSQFIVDGIRSAEIFQALREYFRQQMTFIGLTADREKRFKRLGARDKSDVEDREKRDEMQFNVSKLVDQCDVKMVNNYDSPEEFYREIDNLIQRIGV